jgi:hypothetical protein
MESGEQRASTLRSLAELLTDEEVMVFERRITRLLEEGAYPRLDDYRSVPWPPF